MGKTTNILDLNNRLTKVEKENVPQNSYTSLKNKPKINNVTLTGNKSLAEIGAAAAADIAFDNWIPSNGFNPLTECDGLFCYSVNPDLKIYQEIPTGFSEYGTVFGCSKNNYGLLGYVDIYGRFAIWSYQDNQWAKYTPGS